jgi:hypothetical protein
MKRRPLAAISPLLLSLSLSLPPVSSCAETFSARFHRNRMHVVPPASRPAPLHAGARVRVRACACACVQRAYDTAVPLYAGTRGRRNASRANRFPSFSTTAEGSAELRQLQTTTQSADRQWISRFSAAARERATLWTNGTAPSVGASSLRIIFHKFSRPSDGRDRFA